MSLSVIVAPDSFKGSLGANDAAAAISRGWCSVRPDDRISQIPQADGGEGTLDAIASAVTGSVLHEVGDVAGPNGNPVQGVWLELPDRTAVVELAQCSGLPLITSPDPLGASTRGLGEVICHALNFGVSSLVIGLGGSASTDGGAGALAALGLLLLDQDWTPLADGGGGLNSLAHIDRIQLLAPPIGGVTLLTDVRAPLLGANGAAAVFGPQKGATVRDIELLDSGLSRFADIVFRNTRDACRSTEMRLAEAPGTGSAGGAGFGFAALWGASIQSGASYIARVSGLSAAISSADLVITGEGRFDETSSSGKVVGEIITMARHNSVAIGVIAGQVSVATNADLWTVALADLAGSVESAIMQPIPALEAAGRAAALHFSAATRR